jgi:predicted ester cyclase
MAPLRISAKVGQNCSGVLASRRPPCRRADWRSGTLPRMNSAMKTAGTQAGDHLLADRARRALEDVCSGREPAALADLYSAAFVDHVNDREYHGHDGARESISLYQQLFDDLRFTIEQQVTEGRQVASRWRLDAVHRGRSIRLTGIVISRFDEDNRIVEDWAMSDSLQLVRQLGPRRTLMLLVRHRKLLRGGS